MTDLNEADLIQFGKITDFFKYDFYGYDTYNLPVPNLSEPLHTALVKAGYNVIVHPKSVLVQIVKTK